MLGPEQRTWNAICWREWGTNAFLYIKLIMDIEHGNKGSWNSLECYLCSDEVLLHSKLSLNIPWCQNHSQKLTQILPLALNNLTPHQRKAKTQLVWHNLQIMPGSICHEVAPSRKMDHSLSNEINLPARTCIMCVCMGDGIFPLVSR